MGFLDGLRGLAVALVLVQHVGESLFPAFGEFTQTRLLLGQMGVMVFFLCSGFIIPASLERGGRDGRLRGVTSFWRSRFFRLFPLYWLSLGAAAVLAAVGVFTPAVPMSSGQWLANTVMFQLLLGVPNVLVAYWTLAFELLFYAALSVLFLLGLHRRSTELSLAASALCVALALGAGPLLSATPPTGAFCVATMFTGTVFYRWHRGDVGLATLTTCVVAAMGSGALLLTAAIPGSPQAGTPAFLAMLTAWLGAYAVVVAGMLLRNRPVPALLRRLGTISFSVYLMQALVLAAVPPLGGPVLTALLWVALTIAVSELTYRFVEVPSIGLGRRLGRRRPAPATTTGRVLPVPRRSVDTPASIPA